MLDKQKDKLTLSILDRLKKKGAPQMEVPATLFPEDEEQAEKDPVDPLTGVSLSKLGRKKNSVVP